MGVLAAVLLLPSLKPSLQLSPIALLMVPHLRDYISRSTSRVNLVSFNGFPLIGGRPEEDKLIINIHNPAVRVAYSVVFNAHLLKHKGCILEPGVGTGAGHGQVVL